MKRMKWKEGSYTVEASLILPLIIYVVIALLYICFYLHDMVVIEVVLHQGAEKGAFQIKQYVKDEDEIDYANLTKKGLYDTIIGDLSEETQAIDTYIEERLRKGLFVVRIDDVGTQVNHRQIQVEVKGHVKISLYMVRKLINRNKLQRGVIQKIHNPSEEIRRYELFFD